MKQSRTGALMIAVVLLASTANARPQESAQSTPTGLALEVVFLKGRPAYMHAAVPGPQQDPGGGWASGFGRIAGWRTPDGALPVRAVKVVSRLEGLRVKIWISVLTGKDLIEREEPVAVRELDEGEQSEVAELTRVGVEPITIKVVRVPPHATVLPRVVNKLSSVVTTGVSHKTSAMPSYQIALDNISDKDVAAIDWYVTLKGRKEVLSRPQGFEGEPLIPAGGQTRIEIRAAYQIRPEYRDNPPDFTQEHECVITAAVFTDGTYEGDTSDALSIISMFRGRKIQIARVMDILQGAIATREPDAVAALRNLKAEMSLLKVDPGADDFQVLRKQFPEIHFDAQSRLIPSFRAAMQVVKKGVIDEIDSLERNRAASLNKAELQAWLLKTRTRYERWLSRL